MADTWLSDTRSSYDADATGYAQKVRGLLDDKPYLRAGLALFAESVRDAGGGEVADVGCGPGYVTDHLHDAGVDVFGIGLSPEMIAVARRNYPRLCFEVAAMTDLDLADRSVAGRMRSQTCCARPGSRSRPNSASARTRTCREPSSSPAASVSSPAASPSTAPPSTAPSPPVTPVGP